MNHSRILTVNRPHRTTSGRGASASAARWRLQKRRKTHEYPHLRLVWGIVFLGLAATGLIPGLLHPPAANDPNLQMDAMHGRALGILPVNVLHTLVHAAFGVWGLVASRSWDAAKTFAKATAIIYALFVVMGLVPGLDTTFGFVPLHGEDVWLHLLIAAPAAYFGFFHRDSRTGDRV